MFFVSQKKREEPPKYHQILFVDWLFLKICISWFVKIVFLKNCKVFEMFQQSEMVEFTFVKKPNKHCPASSCAFLTISPEGLATLAVASPSLMDVHQSWRHHMALTCILS